MEPEQFTPSPILFFETVTAYQRSAAIKAAIELDLFTNIGQGQKSAPELAQAAGSQERGMRILCDYLTAAGFLTKQDGRYGLTPDSAAFLDRNSPAYQGSAVEFLLSPMLVEAFNDVAGAVRKGGTVLPEQGTVTAEHPVWIQFARAMAPMMRMPAQAMTGLLDIEPERKLRVLDIAAGHGVYGITLAERYQNAEVTALDWPGVLEVAKENAARAGLAERYRTLPGSAFDVDFGTGYDIVLLTNFLHHFDTETCEGLLRRVHAALVEGGRAITIEFVPNEDRVTPPPSAMFSMVMLASTPAGDAYTFAEFERMFRNAGFTRSELHQLPPTPQQAVIAYK
jgi:ubiquinone/menaquinone biosynthesis C-methylase UbiE